ncbi:MAG TPA: hypothetical protein PLU37_03785 [Chitinophagaceae bacterium]|nr:hypothetical protein [Chitinophagaceae bacterium]MCB9056274.1 hypothetical protein [Chitinophagales bacterium]HPG10626.1 hypothetical protein [Chitinophagaceae bacterium]
MRILLVAILIFIGKDLLAKSADDLTAEKIIELTVDRSGIIHTGRDTITTDDLPRYIQERLFKSYAGTGKMYDAIHLRSGDGGPDATTLETIIKKIREGQERALNELCLQKYKKTYGAIDEKKKEKIKKQFPVLFQLDYLPNSSN